MTRIGKNRNVAVANRIRILFCRWANSAKCKQTATRPHGHGHTAHQPCPLAGYSTLVQTYASRLQALDYFDTLRAYGYDKSNQNEHPLLDRPIIKETGASMVSFLLEGPIVLSRNKEKLLGTVQVVQSMYLFG